MSLPQVKPPVKVPLYQHQQQAFEFVMRIFHSGEPKQTDAEGGRQDETGQDHM